MDKAKAQKALGELLDLSKTLDGNDWMSIQFKTDDGYLWVTLFSEVLPEGNTTLGFGKEFDQVVTQVRNKVESHKREMEEGNMKYRKLIGRMAEKGFTQKDLADELGLVPQTFRYKMQGKYDFKVSEAFAIARILGIDPAEFDAYFGGEE